MTPQGVNGNFDPAIGFSDIDLVPVPNMSTLTQLLHPIASLDQITINLITLQLTTSDNLMQLPGVENRISKIRRRVAPK